jgi:hypothetical protein
LAEPTGERLELKRIDYTEVVNFCDELILP